MSKRKKARESFLNLPGMLKDAEREHIIRVLQETVGIIGGPKGAAYRLGLKQTTLRSKMQKLGICREDYTRIK